MGKYAIGLDYGTLSGRAVLADVADGHVLCESVKEYPHAVMEKALPCGAPLGQDFALQHPQDYLDVLLDTVPDVVRRSGVKPEDIIGIGVDFTACTVLPVEADGTPLCFLPEFENNPFAYVKLWKHHAAQDKATRMTEIAAERGEPWLATYGGKISSEWLFPKLWETLDKAPEVYDRAAFFIEAGDWIVWKLCGVQTRNACMAGYKALWNKQHGYPGREYFRALDARFENVVEEKLNCPVSPQGARAGGLTPQMAERLGLLEGTAVAVSHTDAHNCPPAVGIDGPGKMLGILGTSTCHMMLGEKFVSVPGICGAVEDGIMPGYIGFEAGQCCVGDHFAWLVEKCVPAAYFEAAKAQGMNIHQYLTALADRLRPGQSGLLALDWWNGNRSVLVDADLSGVLLGMTLKTTPEEIYRALIEATAYGTRMIIENYREHGVEVNEFYASGGISQKNAMAMQIYADVINLPIRIAGAAQGPALGSAIFGAVAAGAQAGGFDSVFDAARQMGHVKNLVYTPDPQAAKVYDRLFAEYRRLHDYFGRGENNALKTLKQIKLSAGR